MMPGQIPDPSVTAGSLPGLGPLTGLPSSALTAQELKYADIRNIGAMIAPLHFLEVKLGKRPQPVKSEVSKPVTPGTTKGRTSGFKSLACP
jgi:jun dimerization protein 2